MCKFWCVRMATLKTVLVTSLRRVLCSTLATVFFLIYAAGHSHAQSPGYEFSAIKEFRDASVDTQFFEPTERWDPLSGSLTHEFVDIQLEGNGPPVELLRYIGSNFSERSSFLVHTGEPINLSGFSVPQLKIGSESLARTGQCGVDPDWRRYFDSVGGGPGVRSSSPVTFIYGSQRVPLFPAVNVISSHRARFPATAAAISLDNWYLTCSGGNFRVHTNSGLVYTFEPQSGSLTTLGVESRVFVSQISDPHNNAVNYTYTRNSSNQVTGLLKIQSTDNRAITIREVSANHYVATSNGTPNPVVRDYVYTNIRSGGPVGSLAKTLEITREDGLSTNYEFSIYLKDTYWYIYLLTKLTYPEGGELNYTYDIRSPIFTGQAAWALKERTAFDPVRNLTATYAFSATPKRRTILTPSSRMDFLFESEGSRVFGSDYDDAGVWAGNITRIQPSAGRLVEYRRYKSRDAPAQSAPDYRATNAWAHGPNHLVDVSALVRECAFGGICPGNMGPYLSALNTRLVATTTDLKQSNGSYNNFTRQKTNFDRFGRPSELRETSNDNKTRLVRYEYFNQQSPWINGLVKKKEIFDTTSGSVDRQEFGYNDKGMVQWSSDNDIRTDYRQDAQGNTSQVINAENHYDEWRQYQRGIPAYQRNGEGEVKFLSVNADGTVKSESLRSDRDTENRRYITTDYEYDEMRRLKQVVSARGASAIKLYAWQDQGRHQIMTQGRRTVHKRYDGFGRLLFEGSRLPGSATWLSTVYRYDAEGRLVFKSYPGEFSTHLDTTNAGTIYQYDGLDRLTREYGPGLRFEKRYIYDFQSYSMQVYDGNGSHTTHYRAYGDPADRMTIWTSDGNGVSTGYAVDASGRLQSFWRNGKVRSYIYDGRKQLRFEDNPETGRTEYSYYSDGQLRQKILGDATTTYQYDRTNRLTTENSGSFTRTYNYSGTGKLQNLSAGNVTTRYAYDDELNLTSESQSIDGQTFTMLYEYDDISALSYKTYPTNRRYALVPDALGRLTQIVGEGKNIIGFAIYDGSPGSVTQVFGPDLGANFAWATNYRQNYLVPDFTFSNGRNKVFRQDYRYNRNGNTIRIENSDTRHNSSTPDQMQTMTYDAGNRLDTSNGFQGNWDFDYDQNDNITKFIHDGRTTNFTYDSALNRVTMVGNRTISYDSRGNVVRKGNATGDGDLTLSFNTANQLVSDSLGNRYWYDGNGRRVKEISGGLETYYFYGQSGQLLYRYGKNSQTHSEYHYVGGLLFARRDSNNDDGHNDDGPDGSPECVDTPPIGDGWGWDGTQSCRIPTNDDDADDSPECVDTDPIGDGWGWDGTQSCRVQ